LVPYTADEERDALLPLPELTALPSVLQFQVLASEYKNLTTTDLTFGSNHWETTNGNSEDLEKIIHELTTEFSDDLRLQAWRPYAIVAGIHGGTEKEMWQRLITTIEAAAEAHSRHGLVLHHRPKLSEQLSLDKQRHIIIEISEHIKCGGKLGLLQLATRSEWRQLIKTTSVTAGQPSHIDHFNALGYLAELEELRASLELPWDSMIGSHIQQPFNSFKSAPELSCRALIPGIQRCLDWYASFWLPLSEKLRGEGLRLDSLMDSLHPETSQIAEYLLIEKIALSILPVLLWAEVGRRKLRECESAFTQLVSCHASIAG